MHTAALTCLRGAASLVVVGALVWTAMALHYQLPLPEAGKIIGITLWVAAGLFALVSLWRGRTRHAAVTIVSAFAVFSFWWRSISPSDDRVWADDVTRHVVSYIDSDVVRLTNVRDFAWRTDADYDARWENWEVRLSQLASVDVATSYWMGPSIAHTLVSFGFTDGRFLTFSIEIRKERGESFSAVGGFFKEFETTLIAADERDILRVRTNVRGEDVYLYRVAGLSQEAIRSLFLAYLAEGEKLRAAPRWYNTATANCTTIVFEIAKQVAPRLPLDYRLLVSGYLPQYLYDNGALTPGIDFVTLQSMGRITERAKAADGDREFSRLIRVGLPGA